jgi:putative phosphoribosyl transferase
MRFLDRVEAGKRLAQLLGEYAGRPEVIVLALPRGGVPVAYEIAEALNAPLDVLLVRKLGVPRQEEWAMGAIASGGARILNEEVIRLLGITEKTLTEVARRELRELERRERLYRGSRPMPELTGSTVILVDDGLATGSTMQAAVAALRVQHPARIIVAVPVAATSACELFNRPGEGISCVCAEAQEHFRAVGLWYEDFSQTTDEEVCALLNRAWRRANARAGSENGHKLEPSLAS